MSVCCRLSGRGAKRTKQETSRILPALVYALRPLRLFEKMVRADSSTGYDNFPTTAPPVPSILDSPQGRGLAMRTGSLPTFNYEANSPSRKPVLITRCLDPRGLQSLADRATPTSAKTPATLVFAPPPFLSSLNPFALSPPPPTHRDAVAVRAVAERAARAVGGDAPDYPPVV